jgi:MoxR-like ATPase
VAVHGTDNELQMAVDAVRRRGCLVIAGAPGVGKSRLARELLARLGQSGAGHGFVAATASSRDIPLAALRAGRERTLTSSRT